MATQEITLNKLVLSPLNMRQGEVDVSDLKASFRSRVKAGKPILLQNLRVTAQADEAGKLTGLFEVHVGGRRLRALNELVAEKVIKKTQPITCVVTEDRVDAISESVEENTQRLDPHPADQYQAFAILIESGFTEGQVADRFGISLDRVQRRMALAKVSPKLIELYRAGEIDGQQMAVFTLTDDHAAQEEAYFGAPEGWPRDASRLRQRLTAGELASQNNKLVKLVGLDAYKAAGGAMRTDLFAVDGHGYIQDAGLLDNLAHAKLEEAAEAVRAEGWKWVRVKVTLASEDTHGVDTITKEIVMDDDTSAQVEELSAKYQALEAEGDQWDAQQEINLQITGLRSASEVYRPEEVAIAGAWVTVGSDGLVVKRGYVDKADKKALAKLKAPEAGASVQPKTSAEAISDAVSGLSGVLKENLSAHHTMAIRAAMLDNPAVALVATVHRLLTISHYTHETGAREQGAVRLDGLNWNDDPKKFAPELAESVAVSRLTAAREAMAQRLPEKSADLWFYLLPLSTDDLLSLMAYASSCQVFAIQGQYAPSARTTSAYQLADALALDMADYWTPTAENFFGRVGKPESVVAIREICGDPAADEMAGLKKGDLAAKAEVALAGSRWLPAMLRRVGEPDASPAGDELAEAA